MILISSATSAQIDEGEPNDTIAQARVIAPPLVDFGSLAGQIAAIRITGSSSPTDGRDYFRLTLRRGDVLAVLLHQTGPNQAVPLEIYRETGTAPPLLRSLGDNSCLYPVDGPLKRLPRPNYATSLAFFSENAATYLLAIDAAGVLQFGKYDMEVRVLRGGLESASGTAKQIFFVDFDGIVGLDNQIFNPCGDNGSSPATVRLSPLSDFLKPAGEGGFDLRPSDEAALIDAIVATIRENLDSDLRRSGENPLFDVEIRDSAHHPDIFGQPDVSRVIVGGRTWEFGLSNADGLASAIDPGNAVTTDQAVVLLDLMSGETSVPGPKNLNLYSINPPATRLQFVAQAIGNIASHEIGHLLGGHHTANRGLYSGPFVPNLLDVGDGDFQIQYGAGDDLVFGSGDDIDVDFATDGFRLSSKLQGSQDSRYIAAIGLSISADADLDGVLTNGDGSAARGDNFCPGPGGSTENCDDNCPDSANPSQADFDGNHIGDACVCGDANFSNSLSVSDIVAVNVCIFKPGPCTIRCDANYDSLCNVKDIYAIAGSCIPVCSRYPTAPPSAQLIGFQSTAVPCKRD